MGWVADARGVVQACGCGADGGGVWGALVGRSLEGGLGWVGVGWVEKCSVQCCVDSLNFDVLTRFFHPICD